MNINLPLVIMLATLSASCGFEEHAKNSRLGQSHEKVTADSPGAPNAEYAFGDHDKPQAPAPRLRPSDIPKVEETPVPSDSASETASSNSQKPGKENAASKRRPLDVKPAEPGGLELTCAAVNLSTSTNITLEIDLKLKSIFGVDVGPAIDGSWSCDTGISGNVQALPRSKGGTYLGIYPLDGDNSAYAYVGNKENLFNTLAIRTLPTSRSKGSSSSLQGGPSADTKFGSFSLTIGGGTSKSQSSQTPPLLSRVLSKMVGDIIIQLPTYRPGPNGEVPSLPTAYTSTQVMNATDLRGNKVADLVFARLAILKKFAEIIEEAEEQGLLDPAMRAPNGKEYLSEDEMVEIYKSIIKDRLYPVKPEHHENIHGIPFG